VSDSQLDKTAKKAITLTYASVIAMLISLVVYTVADCFTSASLFSVIVLALVLISSVTAFISVLTLFRCQKKQNGSVKFD